MMIFQICISVVSIALVLNGYDKLKVKSFRAVKIIWILAKIKVYC